MISHSALLAYSFSDFKVKQMLISTLIQYLGKFAASMPEHCSARFQWGISPPIEAGISASLL